MSHRNHPRRSSLISAVVLTVLIHGIVLVYLGTPSPPKSREPRPQRIQILSQKDVQKILNRRPRVSLKKKEKEASPSTTSSQAKGTNS